MREDRRFKRGPELDRKRRRQVPRVCYRMGLRRHDHRRVVPTFKQLTCIFRHLGDPWRMASLEAPILTKCILQNTRLSEGDFEVKGRIVDRYDHGD